MSFDTAQLFRRFENLIRIGTIADIDYPGKRLRVKSGELLTDWLAWPADIGRNFNHWRPLRNNTQVVLACPSGDPAQALIISMLYCSQLDAPSTDEAIDLVQFNDGTELQYDSASATLTITTTGKTAITAPEIEITGQSGDVVVNGISLVSHTHPQNNGNDQGGGTNTGQPT